MSRNTPIDLVFSQSFAAQLAMDYEAPSLVCARHGVSRETFDKLKEHPPFVEAVAAYKKIYDEEGLTAQLKSKIAVEDLIPYMHRMVLDEEIPGAVRKGVFDSLVGIAQFERADAGGQAGFSLVINLGSSDEPKTIDISTQSDFIPQLDE